MKRSTAIVKIPVIDRVYPLEAAVETFQRMEEGQQFGKIGLRIE